MLREWEKGLSREWKERERESERRCMRWEWNPAKGKIRNERVEAYEKERKIDTMKVRLLLIYVRNKEQKKLHPVFYRIERGRPESLLRHETLDMRTRGKSLKRRQRALRDNEEQRRKEMHGEWKVIIWTHVSENAFSLRCKAFTKDKGRKKITHDEAWGDVSEEAESIISSSWREGESPSSSFLFLPLCPRCADSLTF